MSHAEAKRDSEVVRAGGRQDEPGDLQPGGLAAALGIGAPLGDMHVLQGRWRVLRAGDTLFHLGSTERALHLSRRGSLKSITVNEAGDVQVIGFHLPGELLGLDALGSGCHRCQAVALEAAEVCELDIARLEQAARDVPGLQHALLRLMGRTVEIDQDHLALLGRAQAIERLALFLVGLVCRLDALALPCKRFVLPMSRADIASYLGLAIETVSRGFGRLQDDGLIRIAGRKLQMLDLPRLRALAHCTLPVRDVPDQRRA